MNHLTKKQYQLLLIVLCIILIILLSLFFIGNKQRQAEKGNNETILAAKHSFKDEEFTFKTFTTSISLAAVGDLLIHSTVYNDAKTEDGYNFRPMLANVKNYLERTDITIANQETIIGGTEIGLSNYPSFNSPYEVADALQDAGIDIVSIANNHTLDRGEKAILNATSYYNKIGMPYVGGYRSEEDRNTLRILNQNGISVAFLSYTYGTNGIPVPAGKEYLVNLIDLDMIKNDIKDAKNAADVLVVSMHWGNEYQLFPSDQQKLLANELAKAGVDVIIGHHPHVLQPMEWIEQENGKNTFVVYSLGNFLSGQVGDNKDIGGILQIDITKKITSNNEEEITVNNPTFTATYVASQSQHHFKVVLLENAGVYGLSNAKEKFADMNEHMFQWIN